MHAFSTKLCCNVQVPLARGVAEVLLHLLQEAVLTAAALPRGAAQARSVER